MDLNLDKDLHEIVKSAFSVEQNAYRKKIDEQWRILRGDLKHFVLAELQRLYPKTYKSFSVGDINLARKITDKRSKAYKESPLRVLSSPVEAESYADLNTEVGSLWQWRTFDQYKNYFKYAALWFSFYEEDGKQKPMLRALRPSQFSRVVDEKGKTAAFVVYFGSSFESSNLVRGDGQRSLLQDEPEDKGYERIGIWTASQHAVVTVKRSNADFTREAISGNELGVNDLGAIPAVFDQEGDAQDRPAYNSLPDQTVLLNVIYSIILSGMSVQAFGQLVIKYPQSQTMPDVQQNGIFTFLKLPQVGEGEPETTADYISPSPQIEASLNVFQTYASAVLSEHGVNGGEFTGDTKSFTSGLDRLLSQMDTTEIVEDNQQSYAEKEKELFEIIKAFGSKSGEVSFTSELTNVVYKKPKPMQSEKELLEIIKMKLDNGLIEKWEALVTLDPNMSEDDAKAKIEAIKGVKEDAVEKNMQGLSNADNEDEDQLSLRPVRRIGRDLEGKSGDN
jgi:hypothetical protein